MTPAPNTALEPIASRGTEVIAKLAAASGGSAPFR
jgi:hypothetical protein